MTVKNPPTVAPAKSSDPALAAAIADVNRVVAQLVKLINALDARITALGG